MFSPNRKNKTAEQQKNEKGKVKIEKIAFFSRE